MYSSCMWVLYKITRDATTKDVVFHSDDIYIKIQ